ncbi:hypothetical protein FRB93_012731 [Tulasnella sp. JGI-2019a]|nr:hypothetical protein FRB93_012731 [Tulasnella sp. JGI-2019a]
MSIYTALTVPADSFPSLNTVTWSEDGQLLLLTRGTLYILTPDLGIYFDAASATAARPNVAKSLHSDMQSLAKIPDVELKWYRTMITADKAFQHIWAWNSQDVRSLSLGSLDNTWRSACWSPTYRSANGCCLLVTLTSNLELSLWAPAKNLLKGAWTKIQDVTQTLLQDRVESNGVGAETANERGVSEVLGAQVQCLTWSQVPLYTATPLTSFDGSLLAVGTRAGTIGLLRLNAGTLKLVPVHTILVSDSWVTHVAWSSWTNTDDGCCTAMIACALADGTARRIRIFQKLSVSPTDANGSQVYQQDISTVGLPNGSAHESDGRTITSIRWVDTAEGKPLLVLTKSGTILVWSEHLGFCTIPIQNRGICGNSSPFLPPAGFIYLATQDVIILILSDSSFHIIHHASTLPSFSSTSIAHEALESLPQIDSHVLGQALRSTAAVVEQSSGGKLLSHTDLIENCGLTTFDDLGTVLWFHERQQPQDLDYIGPSKHRGHLVVRSLWYDDPLGDGLIDHITQVLQLVTNASPVATLRSPLFQIRHPLRYAATKDRLRLLLMPPAQTDNDMIMTPSEGLDLESNVQRAGDVPHHVREDFCDRAMRSSVWSVEIRLAQLKFNLAYACWKYHKDSEFEGIAVAWTRIIFEARLRGLLLALQAVVPWLNATDKVFVSRMATEGILFPRDDIRLNHTAQAILNRLGAPLPPVEYQPATSEISLTTSTRLNGTVHLGESCPACHAEVAMDDIAVGKCTNGHTWARCSITSAILATATSRTCITCCRKALLPASDRSVGDPALSAWTVQVLLEAVQSCLFCGNKLVGIL